MTDNEILRNIFAKTKARANAKLTAEEQAVMAKYNLTRKGKEIYSGSTFISWPKRLYYTKCEWNGKKTTNSYARDVESLNKVDLVNFIKVQVDGGRLGRHYYDEKSAKEISRWFYKKNNPSIVAKVKELNTYIKYRNEDITEAKKRFERAREEYEKALMHSTECICDLQSERSELIATWRATKKA